jgi:hypothetical protein
MKSSKGNRTFDSRVEDAEAEPVEVVVEGGDVVDVEVHRRRHRG